jgi:hypothetical protein
LRHVKYLAVNDTPLTIPPDSVTPADIAEPTYDATQLVKLRFSIFTVAEVSN